MPLKYDCLHAHFIVGVPARDLTDEEVEQYGGKDTLLASGVYVEPVELPSISPDGETADSDKPNTPDTGTRRSKGA